MEKFSLEKYLENPSHKVVTRRGNPVRIICTDRKHGEDDLPIVFLEENNVGECLWTCKSDGRSDNYDTQYDLFFADEKLTKFEKDLQIIISDASHWISDDGSMSTYCQFGDKEIKKISTQILDLARKELLKDFPKWKKATEYKEFEVHVCVMDEDMCMDEDTYTYLDTTVIEGEYYIELSDLKTLPKEE